jgi:hypothetical protein
MKRRNLPRVRIGGLGGLASLTANGYGIGTLFDATSISTNGYGIGTL